MTEALIFEGRCWTFGDDVSNDDGLMDRNFFRNRIFEPDQLAPHVLEPLSLHLPKKRSQAISLSPGNGFVTAIRTHKVASA